jgi:hypothetical protein
VSNLEQQKLKLKIKLVSDRRMVGEEDFAMLAELSILPLGSDSERPWPKRNQSHD